MIVGTSIPRTIYVQNTAGTFVTYASYAAFQAAGFSITFYGANGVALASQPTITMPFTGVLGRHQFNFIMPNDVWTAKVVSSDVTLVGIPAEFDGEGTTYDIDSVGSSIATSSGVSISDTSLSGTATIYDGNSIRISCLVPESALTAIGASSLADSVTFTSEIKLNSADSSAAAAVTTLTEAITSDVLNNRVVLCTLDTFPAALAVPAGGQQSLQATLQLRITKATKTITANSTQITVLWKATTA